MKEFLEFLIKKIVDHPKEVKITEEELEGAIYLKLSVAQEDMGKVIGKSGRIIRALRDLLKIKAIKENKRVNLELLENTTA